MATCWIVVSVPQVWGGCSVRLMYAGAITEAAPTASPPAFGNTKFNRAISDTSNPTHLLRKISRILLAKILTRRYPIDAEAKMLLLRNPTASRQH